MSAAQNADRAKTIKAHCTARLGFVRSLAIWSTFGKGWSKRISAVEATALSWVLTPADIEAEAKAAKDKAVAQGGGAITINMDPHAQRNIQGLASVGQYLVATSSSDTTSFRGYDNASHDLTPGDLVAMGLQVAQRIQSVYARSWAIKAMDPIPADYADDIWWT